MKKNYIILSILGTLWGIFEMHVGTFLHAMDMPFVGLVMMAFGIFFQTIARCITRMRGSALLMALVVAFLKLLFVGGIAFVTVIAIFIQSLLLELVYFSPAPSRLQMSLAGAVALYYSLFHPFLSMPVFMGLTSADAYARIVGGGRLLLGLPKGSGISIIAILLLLHSLLGFWASFVSHAFAAKLISYGLAPSAIERR
ncbi:hypothetical protein JXA02_07730 [candidate division KSB1 bacterium]|nr:hypothetical protein [candidate division KSB1 bacterium]RQW06264.1 MAG: hypothetical protein EH222_08990 [candidate division KSB1 bacterium]